LWQLLHFAACFLSSAQISLGGTIHVFIWYGANGRYFFSGTKSQQCLVGSHLLIQTSSFLLFAFSPLNVVFRSICSTRAIEIIHFSPTNTYLLVIQGLTFAFKSETAAIGRIR
jgi:hypothetical protein